MKKLELLCYISIVIIATSVVFLPCLFNKYVLYDDESYVIENNAIRSLSRQNLEKMFSSHFVGSYCPLVILSYALEYHYFKLNPFVYHLTNYLLHILITILVFYFIYLISSKPIIAFIAALLFGIHPLHVEPVAWISGRKDLLYSIFYMGALISYLLYLKKGNIFNFIFCLLFAAFSILSKLMAISLPFVIVLFDYFYDRKIDKILILEKISVFLLYLILGAICLYFELSIGPTKLALYTGERIYYLSKVLVFYLYKIIMPINLSAKYGYHSVPDYRLFEIPFYALILLLICILVLFSKKYSKKIIFGCGFFAVTIFPVLQIVPSMGGIYAADRYMYIPSIGIFYIFAVFLNMVISQKNLKLRLIKLFTALIFFLWLILLFVSTWYRCFVWNNPVIFYQTLIKSDFYASSSHVGLGVAYSRMGKSSEAIEEYKIAVGNMPDKGRFFNKIDDSNIYYKMGEEYMKIGKIEDAIGAFKKSVEIRPHDLAYIKLVGIYKMLDKKDEAVKVYDEIIRINPNEGSAYYDLCVLYKDAGDNELAAKYCNLAIEHGYKVPLNIIEDIIMRKR